MAVLPIAVAALIGFAIWRTSRVSLVIPGIAVLMCAQLVAAAILGRRLLEGRLPLLMPLLLLTFACTVSVALSRVGRNLISLPFAWLIGFQCFRLPLELVMHQAAAAGIMPEQMTFTGYNFDILTGVTAIPVAWMAARGSAPRWLLIVWNPLGSVLLAVIIWIALASMPNVALFGRESLNTWVADPPYIWLPGVLVQAALLGHLVVWRKLTSGTRCLRSYFSPRPNSVSRNGGCSSLWTTDNSMLRNPALRRYSSISTSAKPSHKSA